MKVFKWISVILITIITGAICMGCGYTEEEKEEMEKYRLQGEENSIEYLKEKYGIDAKIVDVEVQKNDPGVIPDFWPSPTGNVIVESEYDGRSFYVYTNAETKNTECYDNYQHKEIEEAVISTINEYTNKKPKEYSIYYGELSGSEEYNGLVHEYFDGQNLNEILEEGNDGICGVFEYIDAGNFDNIEQMELTSKEKQKLLFVSYENNEDMGKVTTHSYNIKGTPQDMEIYKNAIYIQKAALLEGDEITYYNTDVKESNGVYYLDKENNEDLNILPVQQEEISNWDGRGVLEENAIALSETYSIPSGKAICIYYPINNINYRYERCIAAISSKDGGKYSTEPIYKIGEYYYFDIRTKDEYDYTFTLIGEK